MLELREIYRKLGIPSSYLIDTKLPIFSEPDDLVPVGVDIFDRPQRLASKSAESWNEMYLAAAKVGVELRLVSAFRSVDYQTAIILRKLQQGQRIEDILKTNAAPGYSEHHTGRAIDLSSSDCEPLREEFEQTRAFHWLSECAFEFGFTLSYPRHNQWGMIYEPWHWCHSGG